MIMIIIMIIQAGQMWDSWSVHNCYQLISIHQPQHVSELFLFLLLLLLGPVARENCETQECSVRDGYKLVTMFVNQGAGNTGWSKILEAGRIWIVM